jgi:hypothetical protein
MFHPMLWVLLKCKVKAMLASITPSESRVEPEIHGVIIPCCQAITWHNDWGRPVWWETMKHSLGYFLMFGETLKLMFACFDKFSSHFCVSHNNLKTM